MQGSQTKGPLSIAWHQHCRRRCGDSGLGRRRAAASLERDTDACTHKLGSHQRAAKRRVRAKRGERGESQRPPRPAGLRMLGDPTLSVRSRQRAEQRTRAAHGRRACQTRTRVATATSTAPRRLEPAQLRNCLLKAHGAAERAASGCRRRLASPRRALLAAGLRGRVRLVSELPKPCASRPAPSSLAHARRASFFAFGGSAIDLDVQLDGEDQRKQVEVKGDKVRSVGCVRLRCLAPAGHR